MMLTKRGQGIEKGMVDRINKLQNQPVSYDKISLLKGLHKYDIFHCTLNK